MNETSYDEELQRKWESFASQSMIGEKFNINAKAVGYSLVDKDKINRMLLNPYISYKELQQCSNFLMKKEGIYYRLIKMLSSMLTYDHIIYPLIESSAISKNKTKLKKAYSEASLFLNKFNVKQFARTIAEDLFRDGECYYYKVEDSTGIIFNKIENKYCLPYMNENGVTRFLLDMSALGSDDITTFPLEIQNAYMTYLNSKNDKSLFLQGKYYMPKEGVCFTSESTLTANHGIPPFCFMFEDMVNLAEKMELKNQIDQTENVKFIHNKIDLGKDKETNTVDPQTAKKYNDAIKNNIAQRGLSNGIFTITNPFTPQVLNLKSNNDSNSTMIEKTISNIYKEIGINQNLFGAESTSSEALKRSIITSSTLCINIIVDKLKKYLDYELSRLSSEIKMQVKILDCTYYNREDLMAKAKDNMSMGGSRTLFLAYNGLTPFESINLLSLEKALEVDKIMTPMQTSYTQSGKSDSGRPSSEDMKNNGEEVSEITEKINDNSN